MSRYKIGCIIFLGGKRTIGWADGGRSVRSVACVGDVRYSLLCVHRAQCKGDLTRAGDAPRLSPAAPIWTFTCARIQASGRISATPVSSASRRSPASIYIDGRTQVGDPAGRTGPPPAPASPSFTLSSKSNDSGALVCLFVCREVHYGSPIL